MAKQIELSHDKVVIVDDEDYEWLSRFSWWLLGTKGHYPYAYTRIGLHNHAMHRLIMDAPKGMQVDHINGDTFDNRRSNLRLATHADNQRNQKRNRRNTSGYKGVDWFKRTQQWRARVTVHHKKIHIGCYATAEEAARAYDEAAKEYFGEFARLNFPDPSQGVNDG